MSKPLTMTVEQEKADRAASRFMDRCGMAEADSADAAALRAWTEVDALRAALAAAEAKLAEVVNRCGLAELAVTQRDIALADERRHADALAVAIDSEDGLVFMRALKAHAIRRAAEVANG